MNEDIETLMARARAGERLTAKQRQECVKHLLATEPISNVKMAALFQVSEGQIRSDKRRLVPKPRPDVKVTFTPTTEPPPPAPEGFELIVTRYQVTVPFDAQERKRLLRDNGRKKQRTRQSSILRMSLAAIAADLLRKGEL